SRRIRGQGDSETYIILLSSKDRCEDRSQGLAAGADDFLTRPCDHAELFARLSVVERIRRMQRELNALETKLEHTGSELARINEIDEKNLAELRATCRELEQAQVQLQAKSITDGLTGLKNHREFQER